MFLQYYKFVSIIFFSVAIRTLKYMFKIYSQLPEIHATTYHIFYTSLEWNAVTR